jgi:hypothetical protein
MRIVRFTQSQVRDRVFINLDPPLQKDEVFIVEVVPDHVDVTSEKEDE